MRLPTLFSALSAIAVAAAATSVAAQSQPYRPVQEPTDWSVNVGAGAVYGFAGPFGDDSESVNLIPWADFNWRDRLYGNPLDGVGYNVVKQDRLRMGVQLRPRYGASSDYDELDLPGLGADAAAYAFVRVPGDIVVGGRIMRDVSGETDGTAWYVSAGSQGITPVGLLRGTAYVRGADGATNDAYYGVPDAAATPELEAFSADGGASGAGAALVMLTPLGERWGLATFVNAERALGDVADSPLIRERENGEWAYRGGVFVVRRFGGG